MKGLRHNQRQKTILISLLVVLAFSSCFRSPPADDIAPDLSLIPAGTITGTVTDAATGLTVSGVELSTEPETVTATTSSEGTFTLSGLASGTYDLIATKTGYATHTTEDLVLNDEEGLDVDLVLSIENGTLRGTVINSFEHGLSTVSVELLSEETNAVLAQTTTDASGLFSFTDIPLATYTLKIIPTDPSYSHLNKQHVTISGAHTITLTLSGQPSDTATYVGSSACSSCHENIQETYSQTSHAQVLKSTEDVVSAVQDFFEKNTALTFDLDPTSAEVNVPVVLSENSGGVPQMTLNGSGPYEILKVYGGQTRKESYLTTIDDHTYVLPVAWSVQTNSFVLDEEEKGNWFASDGRVTAPATDQTYEQRCVGCHVTDMKISVVGGAVETVSTVDSSTPYLEENIGCERCHGPGSEHVSVAAGASEDDSLKIVQPRHLSLKENAQVCGQCHSQGQATHFTGGTIPYPVDANGVLYPAGKDLDDYFTQSNNLWESTVYSKGFHQEYSDHVQGGHYSNAQYNPRCSDCHDPHEKTLGVPHLLKTQADDNSLCLSCHTTLNFPTTESIQLHTQHPYDPAGTGASRCTGCHFTKTGTLDKFADVGGHTLKIIPPSLSLENVKNLTNSGVTEISEQDVISNSCAPCHNQLLDDAAANNATSNALGGDPTSQSYLELLVEAYQAKYEEAIEGEYVTFSHTSDGWMDKNSENHHGLYYLKNPETCGDSCHGKNFEGGALSNGTDVPSCFTCHSAAPHDKRLELDGLADSTWAMEHKGYYTATTCTPCHGEDYRGGLSEVSCYTCHSTPGTNFSALTGDCSNVVCHGTPPMSGAHLAHNGANLTEDVADVRYCDTANDSTDSAYGFGCGTCHPISEGQHLNGSIDVELYNAAAPADSLKSQMPSNARYDSTAGTCSNVYCHSYTEYRGTSGGKVRVPFPLQPDSHTDLSSTIEGQIQALNTNNVPLVSSYFVWNNFKAPEGNEEAYYWSLPLLNSLDDLCSGGSNDVLCTGGVDSNGVTAYDYDSNRFGYKIDYPDYELNEVRVYVNTPAWESNTGLACGGCHGFPPRSYLTQDEWSENDPDWSNGTPTISSEAAIDKHSFVIPKLTEDGEQIEVGHMANMYPFSNAPLRCQVCHVETVSGFDLNSWESGEGWHLSDKGLIEIEDLDIQSRTHHVNGTVDVNFDVQGAATAYRFNNTSSGYSLDHHPSYRNSSDHLFLISPYYYGVKGQDAPGATWEASTKTCSNVSCHLEQTSVQWTNPYRPYSKAECYQCHQYLSNPGLGEDETLCLPHAAHNGCEYRELYRLDAITIPNSLDLGP